MRRSLLSALTLIVIVGALAAANLRRDPNGVAIDWRIMRLPSREVIVEAPRTGEIVQTITAPGIVESIDEAQIASQLIGRVVEVPVKDGDLVKKGDVLVRIDDTDARARLESATARRLRLESAIDQSGEDLKKANRDEDQVRRLAGRGGSTPTELADARTGVAKARSSLDMSRREMIESESMIKTSQQELDRTNLRSPIDGVISGMNVDVGEIVIAGMTNLPGSVLMTVSNLSRMRVRADVDETDVPLVKPDQPANVYLQADLKRGVPGSVDRVAAKGTLKGEVTGFQTLIRVETNEDGLTLRPGMTATVEVVVKRAPEALGVPVQAVIHRRRKDLPDNAAIRAWMEKTPKSPGEKAIETEARYIKIVFVVEGTTVQARPVETGLSDERRIEILSGLKPGERVVVGPFRALDELKDGDPIEIH